MGFDDLIDDKEEEADREKVEELKEELGVEHKEDLEKLHDTHKALLETVEAMDQKIERIEDELRAMKYNEGEK